MGLMDMFANPETFTELSLGDKLAGSGITAMMGMGVTFLVLIILWIFIAIMGRVVSSVEKGDKASEETRAAATPSVAAVTTDSDSKDDLIAVIAAAIAAYEGSGGSHSEKDQQGIGRDNPLVQRSQRRLHRKQKVLRQRDNPNILSKGT